MSNFPDFSLHGYQIVAELGRNREGGRITWKAIHLSTDETVVIKQFCFATQGSNWSSFNAHEQEIEVLQGLNYSGIPRYLDSFPTEDGFCLIQEYKNAPSLAISRSFAPEEIKTIAIRILEILVYLQNRIPPIIHRDIKPENILVDDQLNVYLIDFGFARIGSQEVSASSVFKGTPGFIAPEQIKKPTEASDLYSLGATLICLLTGTKSTNLLDLTADDDPYLLEFKHLLPRLSLRFICWLEKIVNPRLKERFQNAEEALAALNPLYIIRQPEVKLSETRLEFTADKSGQTLTQKFTISNSIPETVLEGELLIFPHLSDPPHTPDSHEWIFLNPKRFNSNNIDCKVTVDTSKLMGDKIYERWIILKSNAVQETYTIGIKVRTAKIPIDIPKTPIWELALYLILSASWWASIIVNRGANRGIFWVAILFVVVGAIGELSNRGFSKGFSILLGLLTVGLGSTLGIGWVIGLSNPYILLALAGTSLPLTTMLVYPPLKRAKLIAKYRQQEQQQGLIKP